jgi:cytochrome c biogenesis protein CcmG/thiol:disulfide interchange protein DsbE
MIKKILLPLWIGTTFFLIPAFHEANTALTLTQSDSPSISSFGVQRFLEKKKAPPFSLKGLDGNTFTLNDFKGKPVLLVFWASWCEMCREEIVLLEKFSQGRKDQLAIVLITIDGERKRRAQQFISKNKITLPVLLLLKEKVMDSYGVRGWVPLIFLIDREGMLVGKIVGRRDWSSPEAWSAIKELLDLH